MTDNYLSDECKEKGTSRAQTRDENDHEAGRMNSPGSVLEDTKELIPFHKYN
jgi:hypothetical protein